MISLKKLLTENKIDDGVEYIFSLMFEDGYPAGKPGHKINSNKLKTYVYNQCSKDPKSNKYKLGYSDKYQYTDSDIKKIISIVEDDLQYGEGQH